MFSELPIAHQLALLDPCAYEYIYADNWTWTVPAGTRWYFLNTGNILVNGDPRWHSHRSLDVMHAQPVPAGTTFGTGSKVAYALVCKPELVVAPSDPEEAKAKLEYRWNTLLDLPLLTCSARVDIGAPHTQTSGSWFNSQVPGGTTTLPPPGADFEYGIIRHVSNTDCGWVIIIGDLQANGHRVAVNTFDEISDAHAWRPTGNVILPFRRSLFKGIWARAGIHLGVCELPTANLHGVDHDFPLLRSTSEGHGGVEYSVLPEGW